MINMSEQQIISDFDFEKIKLNIADLGNIDKIDNEKQEYVINQQGSVFHIPFDCVNNNILNLKGIRLYLKYQMQLKLFLNRYFNSVSQFGREGMIVMYPLIEKDLGTAIHLSKEEWEVYDKMIDAYLKYQNKLKRYKEVHEELWKPETRKNKEKADQLFEEYDNLLKNNESSPYWNWDLYLRASLEMIENNSKMNHNFILVN